MGGFIRDFRHPDRIESQIKAIERRRLRVKLIPETKDEMTRPALRMKVHRAPATGVVPLQR